jgi:hypothetical protein
MSTLSHLGKNIHILSDSQAHKPTGENPQEEPGK